MKDEIFTAWITKHALTLGVQCVQAKQSFTEESMIVYGSGVSMYYAHGNEWHRTREAAIARAEEMRIAKIKSLEKTLSKLRSMSFLDIK